ncbi:MAG: hypothetical protein ACN6QH_09085 [Pseudomonas sp.]|uniref:hypothetical protein n=1 Tax=Pseudomonas sp. TaxID=306 RepID=UPI003D0A8E8F
MPDEKAKRLNLPDACKFSADNQAGNPATLNLPRKTVCVGAWRQNPGEKMPGEPGKFFRG